MYLLQNFSLEFLISTFEFTNLVYTVVIDSLSQIMRNLNFLANEKLLNQVIDLPQW
jgi:hypothetical protein